MPFLNNTWYMAAWEEELAAGSTIGRTIVDRQVVLWRDADGTPSALLDRCPHRLVPLHKGDVKGGALVCGYHGLGFDPAGQCVINPHGRPTESLRVPSFPCVIEHEILWIWIGDPARADPGEIPDLSFIGRSPRHGISRGYMPTAAAHQLLTDNILDLSHADYLHPDTLGGGSISRSKPVVSRGDDHSLRVSWTALDEEPLPIMRPNLGCDRADMWTDVLWYPNGVMVLTITAAPAGAGPESGIKTVNAHIMTPETDTQTHYFYCNSRNFRTDDEAYNNLRAAALRRAFELEDKPMIEAQQRSLGNRDFMEMRPALLPIDAGSVAARRIYSALLTEQMDTLCATRSPPSFI
jgi:phenylpropionate dioxygenase-like ring-hydroxylating dioxygenase large terminal subunit